MTRRVAAAEAKAKFSELVSRVAHGGERVIIERHGKPVAALVSIDELDKMDGAKATVHPWVQLAREDNDIPDGVWERYEAILAGLRTESRPPPDLSDE